MLCCRDSILGVVLRTQLAMRGRLAAIALLAACAWIFPADGADEPASAGTRPGAGRPDVALGTFEGQAWSPWQVTGDAFGAGPYRPGDAQRFPDCSGVGLAWSGRTGVQRQGTLLSPEFPIQRRYLNFRVAGRRDVPGRLGVELLVDGHVVRASSATEYSSLELLPRTWDIGPWAGRTAQIRVNDHSSLGSIAVERFVQSDTAQAPPTDASVPWAETFRPQFHFTARSGWLNDANGLVYDRGVWHLFHQHRPPDRTTIVWGHATSSDLVHWRHQPAALAADGGDSCASGSGLVDGRNAAGLQRGGAPPILLCYTLHPAADSGRKATQCLAFSNDGGRTFEQFPGNPILRTPDRTDRDPKLLFHPPSQAWFLVLSLSRNNTDREHATYGLFRSRDLRSWELLQEIGPGSWYWECPDLFELPLDGDPRRTRWLLVKGSGDYIVGAFDGNRFQVEAGPIRIHWHNTYYGAQSFSDAPAGRRVQIGWMSTGKGAGPAAYPGMPFNQQMSIPRELTLRTTPEGPRLFRQPVAEVEKLRARTHDLGARTLAPGENALAGIAAGLLDIELEVDLQQAQRLVLGCRGAELSYDVKTQKLRLLRADPLLVLPDGRLTLRVLVDRTSIEAFAQAGAVDVSGIYFPRGDDRRLTLGVQGGTARIRRLVVHELNSIWEEPATEVFRANDEWRPIRWEPAHIVPHSALDFSSFLPAPAGRFGPVVCRDGQFVFQNAPQQPVRLYGTDITHALPYLDPQRCRQLADYLAACGYSGVRLHNYTFAPGVLQKPGATEFTPAARDQLDYFLHCLRQRGIYYTLPINSWGFFQAGDVQDVPEFRNRAFRFESNALLPISQDVQRWFQGFARNLLGHVNRYTGVRMQDDPALLSIELANEDSLFAVLSQHPECVAMYRTRCREQLRARLGKEPDAAAVEQQLPAYVVEFQQQYVQAMTRWLRAAGVRQPITDLNFRDNLIYSLPRSQLDYVDIHHYWALYHSLEGWPPRDDAAYRQSWLNPNAVGWSPYLGTVAGRLFGKPFACSEYNGCYASPYWIYTGPMEAALAGLQGWNGVFRCGQAAQPERFFHAAAARRIETSSNPLILLSERIGALLFAQGEVQPLPIRVPLVVTREYLLEQLDLQGGPRIPACYAALAWAYQIGTVVLDGHERLDDYPCLVAPVDMRLPDSLRGGRVLRADAHLAERLHELFPERAPSAAGGLSVDAVTGAAQIVTPRSATFLLPADVAEADGGVVRVQGNATVAVCFTGSLDRRPLSESRHVLAMYLTDVKNTATEVEHVPHPPGTVIVRKPGELPLLVHQGQVAVAMRHPGAGLPEIWALKYDGSRAAPLVPRATADGFSFVAQAVSDAEVFAAYELLWNP